MQISSFKIHEVFFHETLSLAKSFFCCRLEFHSVHPHAKLFQLTWYHNAGVFGSPLHRLVSSISNGEEVRRPLVQLPSFVLLNRIPPIDVQVFVRIHGNNYLPNKCVNPAFFKPIQEETGGEKGIRHRDQNMSSKQLPSPSFHQVNPSPHWNFTIERLLQTWADLHGPEGTLMYYIELWCYKH